MQRYSHPQRPSPCRTVISTLVLCRLEDLDDFLTFVVPLFFWLHGGFQLEEDEFDYFGHFLVWGVKRADIQVGRQPV